MKSVIQDGSELFEQQLIIRYVMTEQAVEEGNCELTDDVS